MVRKHRNLFIMFFIYLLAFIQPMSVYATGVTEVNTQGGYQDDTKAGALESEQDDSQKKTQTPAKDNANSKVNSATNALNDAQSQRKKLESSLGAVEAMKKKLENTKNELVGNVVELDSQMNNISIKLYEVERLLEIKEDEITQTKTDLEQAKKDVKNQYENMKIRIRFMYEQGSINYVQILLSAGSFSEMLNKAEYIESLSEYDRNMLEKFEKTKEKVTGLEEELVVQQQVLKQTQAEVKQQQDEMAGLIEDKTSEISEYEDNIEDKEKAIQEYKDMIEEQDSTIKSLENAVAAAKAAQKQHPTTSGNSTQGDYNGGAFCWPAPSYTRISDDYGYRIHPILGIQQFHNGVDMAAPSGSPILAAYDGTVVAADYSPTMGNYIMIDHGSGLYTIYMHASAVYVSAGEKVAKGNQIAAVGSTGRSTGAHLHFSVRMNGEYVSPWNYL